MPSILDRLTKVKMPLSCPSRRQFIKTSLTEIAVLAAAAIGYPSILNADNPNMTNAKIVVTTLAKALRSIGSNVCRAAADKLEASQGNRANVYFHLRGAALNASDALVIAEALKSLPEESSSALASFSLSYNRALGDAGAIVMAQSLPPTLRELGLVNCGIGDAGGEALLQWAQQAPGLRIMCIEENNISQPIRLQFIELARKNAALWIVV